MTIHEVFIYLRVKDASAAIRFYERAFGAREKFRLVEPGNGRVGHAELEIGGTTVMVSEEYPEMDIVGPQSLGGCSASIHLHVDDADALTKQAVEAGATVKRALSDQFYGERSGTIVDPFGHEWMLGHSIEKVEPEEMQRRWDQMAQ
ncbi:MAG TPA: VOC family protein [Polyangiales bacterium]|nr:VOC family protein [Polyangiales bacterium]